MGRGRNGIIDQSAKKPKISENKIRGADMAVIQSKCKQENY